MQQSFTLQWDFFLLQMQPLPALRCQHWWGFCRLTQTWGPTLLVLRRGDRSERQSCLCSPPT